MPLNTVTAQRRRLATFTKNMKLLEKGRAQVGYFATKASRTDGTLDNPNLAAIHEFGSATHNLPVRSTLRMPLISQLTPSRLKLIDWLALVTRDGAKKTLRRFGIMGEEVVQEAYATGGYGRWPALSAWTIRKKGSAAILIETAQLRKSVASRLVNV